MMNISEQLESAKESLQQVQDFDANSLSRKDELGTNLAFDDAIEPANTVIALFKQLTVDQLHHLPNPQLNTVKGQADAAWASFNEILTFDTGPEDPQSRRTKLIGRISAAYDGYFNALFPIIAYLSSRFTDFAALQTEAQGVIQSVRDDAVILNKSLKKSQKAADDILTEVRKSAAESGVAQQAIYFQEEASKHDTAAGAWRNWTIGTAFGLGAFAILSLFIHKWDLLKPETYPETIQLVVSKVLIFGVIGYMLLLCARNFLSHTHNAIVNKHRQNALMTFKALVDAGQIDEKQDIVLTHAAECIFAPQETGYTKHSSGIPSSAGQTIVRTLPRIVGRGTGESGGA